MNSLTAHPYFCFLSYFTLPNSPSLSVPKIIATNLCAHKLLSQSLLFWGEPKLRLSVYISLTVTDKATDKDDVEQRSKYTNHPYGAEIDFLKKSLLLAYLIFFKKLPKPAQLYMTFYAT